MPGMDEIQQSAELRQAFLRHLPKRLDGVRRRGRRLCNVGWDINALALLYDELQLLAGSCGSHGLIDLSEKLYAVERALTPHMEPVALPDPDATRLILQTLDSLGPAAQAPAGTRPRRQPRAQCRRARHPRWHPAADDAAAGVRGALRPSGQRDASRALDARRARGRGRRDVRAGRARAGIRAARHRRRGGGSRGDFAAAGADRRGGCPRHDRCRPPCLPPERWQSARDRARPAPRGRGLPARDRRARRRAQGDAARAGRQPGDPRRRVPRRGRGHRPGRAHRAGAYQPAHRADGDVRQLRRHRAPAGDARRRRFLHPAAGRRQRPARAHPGAGRGRHRRALPRDDHRGRPRAGAVRGVDPAQGRHADHRGDGPAVGARYPGAVRAGADPDGPVHAQLRRHGADHADPRARALRQHADRVPLGRARHRQALRRALGRRRRLPREADPAQVPDLRRDQPGAARARGQPSRAVAQPARRGHRPVRAQPSHRAHRRDPGRRRECDQPRRRPVPDHRRRPGHPRTHRPVGLRRPDRPGRRAGSPGSSAAPTSPPATATAASSPCARAGPSRNWRASARRSARASTSSCSRSATSRWRWA